MLRTFERALRRASLKVAHTQGFNPRPRLTFALALPLGVESRDEIVDLELEETLAAEEVLQRLDDVLPDGLKPSACSIVPRHAKLQVDASDYQVQIPHEYLDGIKEAITRFTASEAPRLSRERKGKTRVIELDAYVSQLALSGETLSFRLTSDDRGSIKPGELLTWLGFDEAEFTICKVQTHLAPDAETPKP